MGLDTSHGCWRGAYSAFNRFRNDIAKAAGYEVWPVEFEGGYKAETIMLDWGHITPAQLQGEWESTPSDPLLVLFAHSDCDGVIHPAQAGPLADAMERLLPLVKEEENRTPSVGHIANGGGFTACVKRFIDGLRKAAAAGEPVLFH